MYKVSDITKPFYRASEAAGFLGVTDQTIRNYDQAGKLKVYRSEGGHRLIGREDLLDILERRGMLDRDSGKRDVVYVSMPDSGPDTMAELDRQAERILSGVDGILDPVVIRDIGGGWDDTREGLLSVIHMVAEGNVRHVYVPSCDRFAYGGYRYLETMFHEHGTDIIEFPEDASG